MSCDKWRFWPQKIDKGIKWYHLLQQINRSLIDLKLVNILTYNMIRFLENRMCVCVCVCRCSVVSNCVNSIIHPNPSSILVCVCLLSCFSHVQLFATLWTVAHQAPLSMGFSSQGYWSGMPFPSPGNLLDPEIKPRPPASQACSLPSEPPGKPQ